MSTGIPLVIVEILNRENVLQYRSYPFVQSYNLYLNNDQLYYSQIVIPLVTGGLLQQRKLPTQITKYLLLGGC